MPTDALRYMVPVGPVRVEDVVLRSRFICTAGPAASVDEAKAFVVSVRAEFPDATHHCYAYRVGPPDSIAHIGMSDDGEPQGTAGRPMLAVLTGSSIGDVVAVVTRYYGGQKLGTGGLVRAYSGGVKAALAVLPLRDKVSLSTIQARSAYNWVDPVRRLLPQFEANARQVIFDRDVTWEIEVPTQHAGALVSALRDMSRGTIQLTHHDGSLAGNP